MTSKEMLAGRPDWCPLVEIPAHGRLGDLDKLKKQATKRLMHPIMAVLPMHIIR
jgi:hypothetical protein